MSLTPPSSHGGGGSAPEFDVTSDGVVRGKLFFSSDNNQLVLEQLDSDGTTVIAFAKIGATSVYGAPADGGEVGFDMDGSGGPGGHARLTNAPTGGLGTAWTLDSGPVGDVGQFVFIYGSTAPDSSLDIGSGTLYAVTSDVDGTAALWFQTGSGPAAWTKIAPLI